MSLLEKIKMIFESNSTEVVAPITDIEAAKFVDVKTDSGRILRITDMTVGSAVVEITESGEAELEDGSYMLESGVEILVEAGKIAEIKEPVAEDAMPDDETTEEMTETFMDITLKDGPIAHIVTAMEGSINKGDRMMIDQVEARPGTYKTNDGRVITIGDAGVIQEVALDSEVETSDTKESEEVQGIVNNLKNLVNQIKDLKSQFEGFVKENEELKEQVSKFSAAPSAQPTKTKIDFQKADKNSKLEFFSKK